MSKHRNPRSKVSKPPTPDNPPPATPFYPGMEFGILQSQIGLVDALLYATEQHFERYGWRCRDTEGAPADEPLNRLAHLLGAAREAARGAVLKSEVFADELLKGDASSSPSSTRSAT